MDFKRKKLALLLGTFMIMSMFCFSSNVLAVETAGEKIAVKYLKTSDGDTARVMLDGENVRVRFLGINTPEVSGEDKVEEPFGNEALAYTKERLDHAKKIEIEYDDVADHEDRFGRQLAWVWVDDELFELELLEKGLAKTYMLKNDYKYAKELKTAESKAKLAKVGVWSSSSEEKLTEIEEKEIVEGTISSTQNSNLPDGSISNETLNRNSDLKKDTNQEEVWETSGVQEESSVGSVLIAFVILIIIVIVVQKSSQKKTGSK